MEAETLKHIENLVLEAHGKHLLREQTPAIILANEIKTIEHLMEGRARFRGVFSTSIISEFALYLSQNPGGHGFVDPEAVMATAFLNLGNRITPGHADWRANLALKPTAAYAALLAVEGKAMEQKALAEWIEDWSDLISGVSDDGIELSAAAVVAAVRDVTITHTRESNTVERDLGASRSALEQIEAKSKRGLPSRVLFRTTPYLGFVERVFGLRVSVVTGDKPRLTVRIISREQAMEWIAAEFKELLIEAVGGNATMILGSFKP